MAVKTKAEPKARLLVWTAVDETLPELKPGVELKVRLDAIGAPGLALGLNVVGIAWAADDERTQVVVQSLERRIKARQGRLVRFLKSDRDR